MRQRQNPRRHRLGIPQPPGQAQCHEPAAALRHGRRAGAARSRRRRQGRGGERRRRQFQRRPGPARNSSASSRRIPASARRRRPPPTAGAGSGSTIRQADHRHGARLLRRRRVHAAAGLRLRHRRRECDVLVVRGELGHPAGRAGVQGGGRHGAAAPRALLRLPRRAVRRQGGRPHRHDQLTPCRSKSSRTRSPIWPNG